MYLNRFAKKGDGNVIFGFIYLLENIKGYHYISQMMMSAMHRVISVVKAPAVTLLARFNVTVMITLSLEMMDCVKVDLDCI